MPTYFTIPDPDKAQLWDVEGTVYVTYQVPGHDFRMAWRVEDPDRLQGIIGDGTTFTPDKTLTYDQFVKAGTLVWGHSKELANIEGDPIDTARNQMREFADVMPWLRDPEMFALQLSSALEGRQPTQLELSQTNWWRTHNQAERAYLTQAAQDPATAQQLRYGNQRRVRDMLIKQGVNNPPRWLVNGIAYRYTTGQLNDAQLDDTIRGLADPTANVQIPKPIVQFLDEQRREGNDLTNLNRTQRMEDRVRELVRLHLGPNYGDWNQAKIERWAGRLRNDPDAEAQLTQQLQGQLRSLYGSSRDNWDMAQTWEDLASPWITMASNVWGRSIDPADPLVDKLIRMNDAAEANQYLLREGLNRNIGTVVNSTLSDMAGAFDLGVRRMI